MLDAMKQENTAPNTGAQITVAPVAPGRCTGIMPEFLRPADAVRLFGIGKSTLADWIKRGWITSHLVRRPGNKSGCRLIATASLKSFIQSHGAEETA
jgi:hypothetical protein